MPPDRDLPRTRFKVHTAMAGYRLDQFLMRMIPKLSRNRIQKAIASRVRLSWDAPVKPATPVREGGIVVIEDPVIHEESIEFDPAIVYEDDDILAIDKPSGIVVHPTHSHLRNTVITLLRRQRGEDELTLAHRIDAETTGILLLGRHRWAARKLQTAFERGRVDKTYLTLVFGAPEEDEFRCELPLGPYSRDNFIFRQSPKGADLRECETIFRVLERGERFSLIEAQLLTGRRHQIRAHLSCLGYPVVGDKLYALENWDYRRYLRPDPPPETSAPGKTPPEKRSSGDAAADTRPEPQLDEEHRRKLVADRCLLHCHRMEIPNLRKPGERLEIICPMPDDLRKLLEQDRSPRPSGPTDQA